MTYKNHKPIKKNNNKKNTEKTNKQIPKIETFLSNSHYH